MYLLNYIWVYYLLVLTNAHCGDTHIVVLLPLSSSPPYSPATHTLTLSLSFYLSLSLSLSYPSLLVFRLRSHLQTKRSFPSWHLNKSIHSTCHAYQICQLTIGRAGWTARSLYKKGHVFNLRSFNAYIKKKAHQQGPAAPTIIRASQLQHQEGLRSSVHQEGPFCPNTSRSDSLTQYYME